MKWFVVFAIVAALVGGCSTAAVTGAGSEGITKAEFDQIKDGMSYEEVTAIVGGEGELQAESGKPGEELYTVSYSYQAEKGSLGANANVMFQGGKMTMKAQAGLK